MIIEKHLEKQKDLYHNFIDFKKPFDRVWHAGLWQVLRNFNIDSDIVDMIKALYEDSSSAVLLSGQIRKFFQTRVGVRQGCLLSPVLFNLFLENIMQETLENFISTVSIGGRTISNLRFADDIDLMGGSMDELQELTTRLEVCASAYGMEISSEKSKILVNSSSMTGGRSISLNGRHLEEVTTFNILGLHNNSWRKVHH